MIATAKEAHIRLVLVRDEFDPAEADWQTPFLVQISRLVRSSKAIVPNRLSADVTNYFI